jgi:hypothetical protein
MRLNIDRETIRTQDKSVLRDICAENVADALAGVHEEMSYLAGTSSGMALRTVLSTEVRPLVGRMTWSCKTPKAVFLMDFANLIDKAREPALIERELLNKDTL